MRSNLFISSTRKISTTVFKNSSLIFSRFPNSRPLHFHKKVDKKIATIISLHKRHISSENKPIIKDDSWAAEALIKNGENIPPAPKGDYIWITSETIHTPSERVKAITDEFLSLNMIECFQFMKLLDKRLGVSFSSGFGSPAAPVAEVKKEEPKKEEKVAFDIKISAAVDAKAKIKVIKEVRAITGLGLKESKDLVDGAPVVVKKGLKKEEAEAFLKTLTEAGAQVVLE